MHREIKFRVFCRLNNSIIGYERLGETGWESSYLPSDNNKFYSRPLDSRFWQFWGTVNHVRMAFIGLEDKNNKEIYEGDIVRYVWTAGESNDEEAIGEVYFEDGIFYFDRRASFATNDCNFRTNQLEVIGNIFETPELLK